MDIAKLKELEFKINMLILKHGADVVIAGAAVAAGIMSLPGFVYYTSNDVNKYKSFDILGSINKCCVACDRYMNSMDIRVYRDGAEVIYLEGILDWSEV